ncbi:MAG: bifunctional UDP-sugar hydrolase/5'-nucleotidase [Acidimicrobiia bacterium]
MATRTTGRSHALDRPLVRRTRGRRARAAAVLAVGLTAAALGMPGAAGGSAGGDPNGDPGGRDHTDPAGGVVAVQVLSFNDYHGHLEPPGGTDATLGATLDPSATEVGGAEYLATALDTLRQGHPHSLTVAAGDLIGGSPFLSGLFHDEPSVESLEAMGLDVSGVGNHEFDEGLAELQRMQYGGCHPDDGCYFPDRPYDGADFPWLAANVHFAGSTKTVLPGTSVETVGGVRVGFIGMTLEGTPELVAQAGIRGLRFADEVATANAAAAQLTAQGVEAIVVLLHEGGVQAGTYGACEGISGPVLNIAEGLDPAIDLVVTGHTHQPYVCTVADPAGDARMVTSASSFGRVVTETVLPIDVRSGDVVRGQVTAANHLVTRTVAKDPTQSDIIAKWSALAAPRANRVVGTISADITRSAGRDTESSLANLIADSQLAATAAAADGGAQLALMNPGGVRADLAVAQISGGEQPGEVTFGEAFTVQPFGNLLVTMDLTGAQLHAVLEQQAIATRSRPVLILGVSRGFTFSYRATAPFGQRIDPASMALDGVPIDPAATYRVTVNNFLADGGDAFTVFTEGTNRLGGGDDLTAFTDYLQAGSPVAPPATDRIVELP